MDQVRFNEVLTAVTKKGDAYVDCSSIRMTDEQVGILISAMESSPVEIKNLNLSGNAITDAGAVLLAHFLHTHKISEVYLSNNQIGDNGANAFLSLFLADEGHPITFDLRENPCAEDMIVRLSFLAKSQAFNSSIKQALLTKSAESVTFEGLKYSDIDVRLIRFILMDVEGLVSVDFSHTGCGDSGIWSIGQILKDSKVKSLFARKCAIGSMGVNNFIEASELPKHAFLEELDFSENMNITNEIGVQIPNLVFNTNTVLSKWGLTDTSLSVEIRVIIENECELNKQPAALKAAIVALRTQSDAAKEINLQWEKNVSRCMEFMWRYLRDSNVIEKLNISNAGVGDDSMDLLYKALHKNTTLRVIELANNKITAAGVVTLFSQIQRGKCGVQEVNLANNDLADDCASAIINCMRANPNVRYVNIDVNPRISQDYVTEVGGLALINQSPPALRTLLPAIEKDSKDLTEVDISAKDTTYNDECTRMLCRALMINSTVTKLQFSNNIIGDIGVVYIAELLASNSSITEVDLTNNSIGNRGAQKLCDALQLNSSLKVLKLDNNMFDAAGVSGFLEMLRNNNTIAVISMEHTRVPAETAEVIQRACDVNRDAPEVKKVFYRLRDNDVTLQEIDLSEKNRQWPMDDATVQSLCNEIAGRDYIKKISFSGNKIGPEGCTKLAAVLAHEKCAITKLDLSRNPIGDFGLSELTKSFPVNKSMLELDIHETGVTTVGCEMAVPAMKQNDTILNIIIDETLAGAGVDALKRQLVLNNEPLELKHVLLRLEDGEEMKEIDLHHIREREFGDVACKLLCEVILNNKNLRALLLSKNKITTKSAPYITEMIESCPNLALVDLSNNEIDAKGADLFIACVEQTAHIRVLTVKGNPMPSEKQERIGQLLAMNYSSQKLKKVLLQHSRGEQLDEALDFNSKNTGYCLNDEEAQILAHILRDVTEVRALDLGNNKIGDAGCVALAEVLRANHTLQALYIDHNHDIAVASGDALFYALKINPQLHTLELTGTQVPQQIREDIDSLLHINQTSVTDRIDMRATKLTDLNDQLQFKSTDYYVSQEENLECEALDRCKQTEQLLLE